MAQALGFDFGTTNTVLAMADGGATRSMAFTSTTGTADSMRTALSFMKDAQLGASALKVEAGHAAIRQFIDNPGECRFLQSIKTFAASALFEGTLIFAKRHNFEDLMEVFVRRLRNYAGDNWPSDVSRIVTGRPVHFAGASPDPALATERYNEALSRFGFPEIHYVYEPVAAAFYFAQNLKRDATVLVADFGGGTTDYSLIRFETIAGKLTATPIGHSGVGVAGDHFDYRMIDNIVAPLIGKGSHFKSFDKILEVPSNYYSSFGRWNQLSIFKTTREFEDLKKLVRTSWSRKSSKSSSTSSTMTRATRSIRRCRRRRWRCRPRRRRLSISRRSAAADIAASSGATSKAGSPRTLPASKARSTTCSTRPRRSLRRSTRCS